jgi:hypothetical protein
LRKALLSALQLAFIGDALTRSDENLELERFVPVGANLDAMPARLDTQPLEHAVEAVDDADEIPVV